MGGAIRGWCKPRSPCGAEWVRESRPEQSQDPVGGAGSSPLQGGARSLAATPVARQSGVRPEPDPTRVVPRSVHYASVPSGTGVFLRETIAVVRRQR